MSSHWEHRLYSQKDLSSTSSPGGNVMLNETLWASVLSSIKWDDNISYIEQSEHVHIPWTLCHLLQQWNIRAQSPQCRVPGWMPHWKDSVPTMLCMATEQGHVSGRWPSLKGGAKRAHPLFVMMSQFHVKLLNNRQKQESKVLYICLYSTYFTRLL